jgi:hypothetical protein
MRADTVIIELPSKDEGHMKQLVANNIGKLKKKQNRYNESRKDSWQPPKAIIAWN